MTGQSMWSVRPDAEPGPEVTHVKDVEGGVWQRGAVGWDAGSGQRPWSVVLKYAPLVDATAETAEAGA